MYNKNAPIPKTQDKAPLKSHTFVLHFSGGKRSNGSKYWLSPFLKFVLYPMIKTFFFRERNITTLIEITK